VPSYHHHCDETSIRYPGIYIRSSVDSVQLNSAGTDACMRVGLIGNLVEEEPRRMNMRKAAEDAEDDEHDATHTE